MKNAQQHHLATRPEVTIQVQSARGMVNHLSPLASTYIDGSKTWPCLNPKSAQNKLLWMSNDVNGSWGGLGVRPQLLCRPYICHRPQQGNPTKGSGKRRCLASDQGRWKFFDPQRLPAAIEAAKCTTYWDWKALDLLQRRSPQKHGISRRGWRMAWPGRFFKEHTR